MSRWDVKKKMSASERPLPDPAPLPDACTKCGEADVELFFDGERALCEKCRTS